MTDMRECPNCRHRWPSWHPNTHTCRRCWTTTDGFGRTCWNCGGTMVRWRPPRRAQDPRPPSGRANFEKRAHAHFCPTCDGEPEDDALYVPVAWSQPRRRSRR